MSTKKLTFDSIHVSYGNDHVIRQTREMRDIDGFLNDIKLQLLHTDFYKMIIEKEDDV